MKSGYRLLRSSSLQALAGVSEFKWLKFWKLSIPPKFKNFLWRVLHDCLPTLEILGRKFVDVHPICQVCKLSRETLDHILMVCLFAANCWHLSNTHLLRSSDHSFIQMIFQLFDLMTF